MHVAVVKHDELGTSPVVYPSYSWQKKARATSVVAGAPRGPGEDGVESVRGPSKDRKASRAGHRARPLLLKRLFLEADCANARQSSVGL